jgi:hypothetical protein
MDMAYASPSLPKMATNYLRIIKSVRAPITLQAPYAYERAAAQPAGFPAPYAHQGMQLG